MSVIFFGPKMGCSPKWPRQSHEDMWNPLCFHGTGLQLPTRRRRWQSAQGNSIMESQETLAQLFQLAIANGSGPRGSTSPFGSYGIVMLFFVFRDLLFCGSGIILWFWHSLFLKIRKRKRLTSVNLVQMLIVVWGRGVCVY